MKKSLILSLALSFIFAANADGKTFTLDLTKATTQLAFDANTGSWTGTYDDDEESIESQCFSFVHSSMGEYKTWWGFTASNSNDNLYKADFITYQFSNMAKGGIALNEDGTFRKDQFGGVGTDSKIPYIVAYYSPYMSRRPVDMTFTDGKTYEAVGMYVNLNTYTYYSLIYGASPARVFTDGDKLTLTVHGVNPDNTEKTVDVTVASCQNGDLTASSGWKYVDLSPLGKVNELYFTMNTTDTGAYGANTPLYFCLDKLTVREPDDAGIQSTEADNLSISYDRSSHIVSLSDIRFAMVCDITGATLRSGETDRFDLSDLPAGVYIIKAGAKTIKITK